MNQTEDLHHNKSLHGWLDYGSDAYLDSSLAALNPQKGEKILHNRCGNGRFYVLMSQKGASVVALDVNKSLLNKAARMQEKKE